MDNLERLIDTRELEVPCPHCRATNAKAIGWLRDRHDMSCQDCDELIVLGTAQIRSQIRNTARQLRDLSESLQTQLRCWS
ncbi:MAG: hypothetical protein EOO70_09360, partial [Myxococcaceae bacterium]